MCGLRKNDIVVILQALQKFVTIECAVIFGSRAMGTYKKGSDIDIAIMGDQISRQTVQKLHYLLEEESSLPYFFDIIHYESITNKNLQDHIERFGVAIYDTDQADSFI